MPRARYQQQPWPERVAEYRQKREFYETYYPGTEIKDMPYRLPKWAKRGPNWEKASLRMNRLRRRVRYGG
jgi:hypothetical protein